MIGSVLLLGLLNGFTSRIEDNPAVPKEQKAQIVAATEQGIPIVTTEVAHDVFRQAGATEAQADAITADYADAELQALKRAMLAVAFLALLSLWFTRHLPKRAIGEAAV